MAKVCIDAGHGGLDAGAVNGKMYEKDYTLSIAIKVADKLEALGHTVYMTREMDKALTLQQRCDVANKNKCNAFVSVHLNSSENKNAEGVETFMWKKTDKKLAAHIQDSLVALFPDEKNRGLKTAQYYVLKNTNVPSALVEVGFLSHDPTAEKFHSYYYQNRLAEAIVNGILRTVV